MPSFRELEAGVNVRWYDAHTMAGAIVALYLVNGTLTTRIDMAGILLATCLLCVFLATSGHPPTASLCSIAFRRRQPKENY